MYSMGLMFGGGGYGFSRRFQKKAKPKKKPKENWFERLSVDELKQLCKATKMKTTGNKGSLIAALCDNEATAGFGTESVSIGGGRGMGMWGGSFKIVNGTTIDSLKEQCRSRFLQLSGTKFQLVLRILQCDNDSALPGQELKRKATVIDSGGVEVAVSSKKPRTASRPVPTKLYEKVEKKVLSSHQKKYQSNSGSKDFAQDVYDFMLNTYETSVEPFASSDPLLALDCAASILGALDDNFDAMLRPGYGDEGLETLGEKVNELAESTAGAGRELAGKMADVIEGLAKQLGEYGLEFETGAVEGLRKAAAGEAVVPKEKVAPSPPAGESAGDQMMREADERLAKFDAKQAEKQQQQQKQQAAGFPATPAGASTKLNLVTPATTTTTTTSSSSSKKQALPAAASSAAAVVARQPVAAPAAKARPAPPGSTRCECGGTYKSWSSHFRGNKHMEWEMNDM